LLEHLVKTEIENICYSDRKAAADICKDVTEISDDDLFDTLLANRIDN